MTNIGDDYRDYYDLDGTNTTVLPTSGVSAQAAGGSIAIFYLGSRLTMALVRNGFLWTCQTVGLNGTDGMYRGTNGMYNGNDVDRSAIQWLMCQVTATGLALSQHGRIYDAASTTNAWWYHFPSLAVNCPGDMIAGFSGSSATDYIGAFFIDRLSSGFMPNLPSIIQPGLTDFSGEWGHYSATTIDPADDWAFWTVQTYAAPSGPHNLKHWRTAIAHIRPGR